MAQCQVIQHTCNRTPERESRTKKIWENISYLKKKSIER